MSYILTLSFQLVYWTTKFCCSLTLLGGLTLGGWICICYSLHSYSMVHVVLLYVYLSYLYVPLLSQFPMAFCSASVSPTLGKSLPSISNLSLIWELFYWVRSRVCASGIIYNISFSICPILSMTSLLNHVHRCIILLHYISHFLYVTHTTSVLTFFFHSFNKYDLHFSKI